MRLKSLVQSPRGLRSGTVRCVRTALSRLNCSNLCGTTSLVGGSDMTALGATRPHRSAASRTQSRPRFPTPSKEGKTSLRAQCLSAQAAVKTYIKKHSVYLQSVFNFHDLSAWFVYRQLPIFLFQ